LLILDAIADDDLKCLREERKLMHNLMLYERHRRETLGMRNRRLLGKTKSSRILEEQNTALVGAIRIILIYSALMSFDYNFCL
jgi:hypothetical protein